MRRLLALTLATLFTASLACAQTVVPSYQEAASGNIRAGIGVTVLAGGSSGITPVSSAAAEACHVLKASAGQLYSASGVIGAAGYIMVFNAVSAPADGAVVPVVWAYAPAQGSWSINYGASPAAFATGITVCASSTGPFTKTAYSTNTAISGAVQ